MANIIKDLTLNEVTGKPVLVESIEKLKAHSEGTDPLINDDFEKVVLEITKECDKVRCALPRTGNLANNILSSACSLFRTV